jgi:hypothetical protein
LADFRRFLGAEPDKSPDIWCLRARPDKRTGHFSL